MRVRLASGCAVAAAIAACSTFGSSGGDADGGTIADAGGPPDGSAPPPPAPMPDAATDGDAPSSGALFTDDFESGTMACGGWVVTQGSAVRSNTAAHGGSWSCHFCGDTTKNGYIQRVVSTSAAGSFTITVWARTPDGASQLGTSMFALKSGQLAYTMSGNETSLPLDGGWVPSQTGGSSDGGLDQIEIELAAPMQHCVDFDDDELDFAP